MRENTVKRKLQNGEVSLGTFVFEFDTTGIGRIAAGAGAEFVIYDMEHTGWSVERIRTLMAATRSADIVPLVRVPATQYEYLSRVLDMGAMGAMIPMVESADEAKFIASSTLYPPAGRRGSAFGMAHDDYTGGDIVEKQKSANAERLILAQIETAKRLDAVDEIAAVDGIDVLWVGQTDLSSSMGIPGQFESAEFGAALDKVAAAAEKHGKTAGYMAMSIEEAKSLRARGFRAISYAGDLYIYQTALRDTLATLKETL